MRQVSKRIPDSAEKTVRDIRRAKRRHHSTEEKIRIVLEGLRGEVRSAELCRKEDFNQNHYYRWSKEFLEAGKKRLAGDTGREATSDEVKELQDEARQLKETLGRLLKKSVFGDGDELVEQSTLPVGRTLASIGISRSTFVTGTAAIRTAGSKPRRMASPGRAGSGTRSPMKSARRSSTWHLRSRTCRRGSLPSTSRMRRLALCRRPAFIASEEPRSDHQPSLHPDDG
jgi:transposase